MIAVRAVRLQHPRKIVAAVPIASRQAETDLRLSADEVICADSRDPFYAVGYWYREFDQVTDEEVRDLLCQAEAATKRRAAEFMQ